MDIPNGEEKKGGEAEFGKVIDALHSKQKLSSLRTYQGDMAEFIKNKNESVVSIALKEKEKRDEEEKLRPRQKQDKKSFHNGVIAALVSFVLIAAGAGGLYYAYLATQKEPAGEVTVEEKIIPYNNLITLANVTSENLGEEISKISPLDGISIFKISGTNGIIIQSAQDFLSFLEVSPPVSVWRILKDEYAVGTLARDGETSRFIVIGVEDFARAFSGMLDWEADMEKDLSFLNATAGTAAAASSTATTTEATIPLKQDVWVWGDAIVKNKDTRALLNQKNQAKIAYTFLDKSTILITNSLKSIGDIYAAYSSRSVVK